MAQNLCGAALGRRLRYVCLLAGLTLLTAIPEVHSQSRLGVITGTVYLPVLGNGEGRSVKLTLANPDSSVATIRVFGYNDMGAPLNGSAPLLAEFQVGSGQSIQLLDINLVGLFLSVPSGWLKVEVFNAEVSIHANQQDRTGNQNDGFLLSGEIRRQLILPRIYQGTDVFAGQSAETLLHIVNPNPEAVRIRLRLFSSSPGIAATPSLLVVDKSFDVPALGRLAGQLSSLLGETTIVAGHLLIDSETTGIVAAAEIRFPAANSSLLMRAIAQQSGSNAFLNMAFQAEDFLDSGYPANSRLRLVNTAEETRTIEINAVSVDEDAELTPFEVTLEGGQSLEADINEMFSLGEDSTEELVQLSLRIAIYGGRGVVGGVLVYEPEELRFATEVPFEGGLFERATFSPLVALEDPFSYLSLTNPGPDPAELTLRVFAADGQLLRERDISLDPNETFARDVSRITFPSFETELGYLSVISDEAVHGSLLQAQVDAHWLSLVQPKIEQPGAVFPFHRPEFCLGDVAATGLVGAPGLLPQDGVRDAQDVDLLLQVAVRNEFLRGLRLMSADVNQDEEVDVRDVVRLLQHIQGDRLLPDCGAPELDFSPGDISDLEVWLIPEPLTMFQDIDETDRVRGEDDLIAVWKDQSGNQNDFVQPDEDRQPLFVEDVLRTFGGITFDGEDDFLGLLTDQVAEVGAFYIVLRWEEPLNQFAIAVGHVGMPLDQGHLLAGHFTEDFRLFHRDHLYTELSLSTLRVQIGPAPHNPDQLYFTLSAGSLLDFNSYSVEEVVLEKEGQVE